MSQSKYFFVSNLKEQIDTTSLVDKIYKDWMYRETVIVNCFPEYSSSLTQKINHRLSCTNRHELYEQLDLCIPYPVGTQIWNPYDREYQLFDRYLQQWVTKNIKKDQAYLFVTSAITESRPYNKIKTLINTRLDPAQYRFSTLYLQSGGTFTPDYYIQEFDKEEKGGILFEWENLNNPNWDY